MKDSPKILVDFYKVLILLHPSKKGEFLNVLDESVLPALIYWKKIVFILTKLDLIFKLKQILHVIVEILYMLFFVQDARNIILALQVISEREFLPIRGMLKNPMVSMCINTFLIVHTIRIFLHPLKSSHFTNAKRELLLVE